MSRRLTVGAGQMGPIARDESKSEVVDRLMAMLHEAHGRGSTCSSTPNWP